MVIKVLTKPENVHMSYMSKLANQFKLPIGVKIIVMENMNLVLVTRSKPRYECFNFRETYNS